MSLKHIHILGAVSVKMASMAIWHRTAFESTLASITSYNRKRHRKEKRERGEATVVSVTGLLKVSFPKGAPVSVKIHFAPSLFFYCEAHSFCFVSSFPRFVCLCLALLCEVISPFCPPLPCQSSHAGNHSPIKKMAPENLIFFLNGFFPHCWASDKQIQFGLLLVFP